VLELPRGYIVSGRWELKPPLTSSSLIDGYWISVIAPIDNLIEFTTDPLPIGTNVWTTISLSEVDTLFYNNSPDPTFAITAFINWWTVYNPDGSESGQQSGTGFTQNAAWIENCARISYILFGERVAGMAQVNVWRF
jgi:hypothetical protein